MKERIVSIVLIVIILISTVVYGDEDIDIDIDSNSAILMDYRSGEIIYAKNENKELSPASITKIMTLLLTMEALDKDIIKLTDKVTISEYASSMGGTQLYLDPGERQTVESLIKAVAVRSANDAAVALGEYVAGSNEKFIQLMNSKAKKLGMKNTNFSNSTGLPKENHYSTAYDVAIMSRELLKHERVIKYLSIYMEDIEVGKKKKSTQTMVNTNKLIKEYEGITGIKTGFTNEAKHCVSASAKKGDLHLIAVIMGAENSKLRFDEAKRLLDYGFSNYESVALGNKGDIIDIVPVDKGRPDTLEIVLEKDIYILLPKKDKSNIEKVIEYPEYIKAPIEKNKVIGKISILNNNKVINNTNLVSNTNIKKARFIDLLGKSTKSFLFNN